MTKKRQVGCAILVLASFGLAPARAEDNLRVMLEAARKLEFFLPENRAFLLVKQEPVTAPVAVIFGYADNATACEAVALTLSTSGRDGIFKCQPIY